MNFRFSKLPKHAQFEYKPRYYDPEREKFGPKDKNYDEGSGNATMKNSIANGFRRTRDSKLKFKTFQSAERSKSNRRLLIITVLCFLMAYFILSSNLEGILSAMDSISK